MWNGMINIYMREEYIWGKQEKITSTTKKEQELSSPSSSRMSSNEKNNTENNAQTAKGNFSTDPATTPE
jgi:hypothetical protein